MLDKIENSMHIALKHLTVNMSQINCCLSPTLQKTIKHVWRCYTSQTK